jgi:hypothetical protein
LRYEIQEVISYLDNQKLDNFILFLVTKNDYDNYNINPQVYNLFASQQEFIKYISNRTDTKKSKLYIEFLEFVNKLKGENSSIEYVFKKINI